MPSRHREEPNTATLALFDQQMRRSGLTNHPGVRAEWDGPILRYVSVDPDGDCTVIGSQLDESNADTAIAEQVRYFAEKRRSFEWKYYTHDRPSDLPDRLRAAGFQADEPEAVMIANAFDVSTDAPLPEGIRIEVVADAPGLQRLVSLHDEVFGARHSAFGSELRAQLRDAPDTVTPLLAVAGDRPVCGARIEFHRGTEFASLWGGGTLPEWRGRGIYRALVAHRARLAAARGVRYLHVDASTESQPILERLGFVKLSTTIPYWKS